MSNKIKEEAEYLTETLESYQYTSSQILTKLAKAICCDYSGVKEYSIKMCWQDYTRIICIIKYLNDNNKLNVFKDNTEPFGLSTTEEEQLNKLYKELNIN